MQQEQLEDGIPIDQFTQWSADNADHNIPTIDGNTHIMAWE